LGEKGDNAYREAVWERRRARNFSPISPNPGVDRRELKSLAHEILSRQAITREAVEAVVGSITSEQS